MLHILKCSKKAAEVHTCTRLLHIVHTYWLGFTPEREREIKEKKKKEKKEKKGKKGLFVVREREKRKEKKRKEKEEKGLFVVLLHCFRWCVVTSFVSRLAPLARSRLGPAQYHR